VLDQPAGCLDRPLVQAGLGVLLSTTREILQAASEEDLQSRDGKSGRMPFVRGCSVLTGVGSSDLPASRTIR
jgi:hypothetical protein